jgi:hypothetical protein
MKFVLPVCFIVLGAGCSSSESPASSDAGSEAASGSSSSSGAASSGAASSSGSGPGASSSGGASSGGSSGGGSGSASSSGSGGGGDDGGDDGGNDGGAEGSGGSGGGDGGSSDSGGGGDGGSPEGSIAGDGGGMLGWYEAEAIPPNQLSGPASVVHCGAGPCAATAAIKPGDLCCSGGEKVGQILGRAGGALQYSGVSVPSDGMYDVTWWYHCGKNDNFGDTNCGGQTDPPTTPSGCRPHQIVVNGTEMQGTYHFPCFPGDWGIIRAATTPLLLKAGATNTIKVYSKAPRDSADMDAIEISAAGSGVPPTLTSNSDSLGH